MLIKRVKRPGESGVKPEPTDFVSSYRESSRCLWLSSGTIRPICVDLPQNRSVKIEKYDFPPKVRQSICQKVRV